jgi:hypothetical protein
MSMMADAVAWCYWRHTQFVVAPVYGADLVVVLEQFGPFLVVDSAVPHLPTYCTRNDQ